MYSSSINYEMNYYRVFSFSVIELLVDIVPIIMFVKLKKVLYSLMARTLYWIRESN